MDLGIAGKVAIVTGGASGIGAATVHMLAEEGVRVAVFDAAPKPMAEAELMQSVDVTNRAALESAWLQTETQLGSVDIVVRGCYWFRTLWVSLHKCTRVCLGQSSAGEYPRNGEYGIRGRSGHASPGNGIHRVSVEHRGADGITDRSALQCE